MEMTPMSTEHERDPYEEDDEEEPLGSNASVISMQSDDGHEHHHTNEVAAEFLQTDHTKGLSHDQVEQRLRKFGKNQLPEEKSNHFLKFIHYFTSPIEIVIEIAALLALGLQDWVTNPFSSIKLLHFLFLIILMDFSLMEVWVSGCQFFP